MEGLTLFLHYLASFLVMWGVNCPKYGNMPQCIQALQDITVYISDYNQFERDITAYLDGD